MTETSDQDHAEPPLLCLTVDEAKIIRKLLGDLPQSKLWHDLTDEQYEVFCGTTWPKLQKATSDEVRRNEKADRSGGQ